LSDITSPGSVDIGGTRSERLCPIGHNRSLASFADRTKLNEAIEEVKRDTRAYAKRQMTWFKKDKRVGWFDIFEVDYQKKVEKIVSLKMATVKKQIGIA